jgi:hypothetical protein
MNENKNQIRWDKTPSSLIANRMKQKPNPAGQGSVGLGCKSNETKNQIRWGETPSSLIAK